jgi:hypothetical protein
MRVALQAQSRGCKMRETPVGLRGRSESVRGSKLRWAISVFPILNPPTNERRLSAPITVLAATVPSSITEIGKGPLTF